MGLLPITSIIVQNFQHSTLFSECAVQYRTMKVSLGPGFPLLHMQKKFSCSNRRVLYHGILWFIKKQSLLDSRVRYLILDQFSFSFFLNGCLFLFMYEVNCYIDHINIEINNRKKKKQPSAKILDYTKML
jgi:hypothetical protein